MTYEQRVNELAEMMAKANDPIWWESSSTGKELTTWIRDKREQRIKDFIDIARIALDYTAKEAEKAFKCGYEQCHKSHFGKVDGELLFPTEYVFSNGLKETE